MAPGSASSCFPGSNCEQDVVEAVATLGGDAELLWHGDATRRRRRRGRRPRRVRPRRLPPPRRHRPVLAGDGARSPSSRRDGGPVVGICNGFQVLTEAGLLPGALQKNRGPEVPVHHRRAPGGDRPTRRSPRRRRSGDVLRIPINHFEGNYTCAPETLAELQADDRIVLRYVDNPNGSVDDIAGICNDGRNVVGLMPHPERAVHATPRVDRRGAAAAVAPGGGRRSPARRRPSSTAEPDRRQ